MTKRIFTLICISISFVLADQPLDIFSEANQLYQKGDFEAAIEKYEKILSGKYESGELYYNLGNAYYKTGNIGKARLNYERALIWLEDDESVVQNLDLLKLRLVDQIEEPPKLFINVWWEKLLNLFDTKSLGIIVLILFWLVLITAAIFMHYRKRGMFKWKSVFVASLILWLLLLTIWINKIYLFETEMYGVILASTTTVYSEPAENTTELFVLHEGTRVKVERASGSWYEIRLADGKTGWLINNVLEVI
jgi:tetratricopeptide (TPR) repeat protein